MTQNWSTHVKKNLLKKRQFLNTFRLNFLKTYKSSNNWSVEASSKNYWIIKGPLTIMSHQTFVSLVHRLFNISIHLLKYASVSTQTNICL